MNNSDLEQELSLQAVENDTQRLVFPINVQESLAASGGLKRGEKTGIIMSFWLFFCALLAWFLGGWLRQIVPDYYVLIVVCVEVALQLTVGVFLLQLVTDKSTMTSEMRKEDKSFVKYFDIYHEILADDSTKYDFDMLEFRDGSYGVFIQMLLGYNTNSLSASTYEFNKAVLQLINRSGMRYRVTYSDEKFSNSAAADNLRNIANNVEDEKLFGPYRDIAKGVLDIADTQSNVCCTTYCIFAKTRIEKEEIISLVNQIMDLAANTETAYREVMTLSYHDIVEYYRQYYKLEILDMGLLRVHTVQRQRVQCAVKLLKVYGKSGKIYATADFTKLKENLLEEFGLTQVNKGR